MYEPLVFLSGTFKNNLLNWSVPENEGYAIVEATTKLDYLTMGPRLHILTDHANVSELYDPENVSHNISRYAINKMMRSAMKIIQFHYRIEQIHEELNLWADMLTRWGKCQSTSVKSSRLKLGTVMLAPTSPSLQPEFDWSRHCDIKSIQPKQRQSRGCQLDNGLRKNEKGDIFIGNKENKIKMRLLVAAHVGLSGRRVRGATRANLPNKF